ncbi:hypothetical protein ACVGWG_07120 [Enterobacter asburiae]|nr:hypothetical protein [Enterobacter asburiae]
MNNLYLILCAALLLLLSGIAIVLTLAFKISSKEKGGRTPPED